MSMPAGRQRQLDELDGGCARGLAPLAGGAGRTDRASAFCWARDVPPAWGEPARPGFPRRGNGKGEIQKSSLPTRAFSKFWG